MQEWDKAVFLIINQVNSSSIWLAWNVIISSHMFWIIVFTVLCSTAIWRYGLRYIWVLMFIMLSSSMVYIIGNYGLKPAIQRPRPCHTIPISSHHISKTTDDAKHMILRNPKGCHSPWGMPSNHVLTLTYVMMLIYGMGYHKLGFLLFMGVICVGYSRIYLGVHYLSDVIAGLGIGILIAIAVCTSIRRYHYGDTTIHE